MNLFLVDISKFYTVEALSIFISLKFSCFRQNYNDLYLTEFICAIILEAKWTIFNMTKYWKKALYTDFYY